MFKKFMFMVAVAIGFASCGKDKEAPVMTLKTDSGYTYQNASVQGGTTLKAGFDVTATADLKNLKITVSYDGGVSTTVLDSAISGTTFSLANYSIKTRTAAGTEKWMFTVTDKNDLSASKDFTITTTSAATINSFTAKLMGAQSNATLGSFMATTLDSVFGIVNAKANASIIDLLYFESPTNGATIAAPDDNEAAIYFAGANNGLQTWSVKNSTKFTTTGMTAAAFDSVADVNGLGSFSPTASKANSLSVGKVVAFTTVAGKKGLIKINRITTGATGDITVDVKVQK